MNIKKNLVQVNQNIQRVAELAGRDPASIKLVVVTKSQPVAKIIAVVEAGHRLFGENYPEETLPKILEMGKLSGISWHMIGHLQSRKSGIIAEYFNMMHSLDSIRIAQKLELKLEAQGRMLPVLLEMNVGGEESKSGWKVHDESMWPTLLSDLNLIRRLPHLEICGLMTMPPWNNSPEENRLYFKKMRHLRDYLQRAFPQMNLQELSMGTSQDYEVAIQEGATYIRIGRAIMGDRLALN